MIDYYFCKRIEACNQQSIIIIIVIIIIFVLLLLFINRLGSFLPTAWFLLPKKRSVETALICFSLFNLDPFKL